MAIARDKRPTADAPRPRGAQDDALRLGRALFPVRLFLGVTFVYAGVQKLSDPGFFHAGAPTYIATQLKGFARGTPGGFLLRAFAIPHPTLAGAAVALAEIAIGLLVASGIAVRPSAAAGLALNALLFFTNSWHTYPYFLGPDIVFVFAWLPFVMVGASQQPSLAPALRRFATERARRRGTSATSRGRPDLAYPEAPGALEPALTRRAVVRSGIALFGAATGALAAFSLLIRGSYKPPRTLAAAAPSNSAGSGSSTQPAGETQSASSAGPSGSVKLGPANRLARGEAASYSDPSDGSPDIVIRQSNGALVAYSAVCTHAGCTVGYEGGQIVCPCHGAVYDPQTGAVVSGPAPAGLTPRKVSEQGGEIYALPG